MDGNTLILDRPKAALRAAQDAFVECAMRVVHILRSKGVPIDPSQERLVIQPRGPVLGVADAGAGKTNLMALRFLIYVVFGTPYERILATTFTNKAADNLLDRVAQLLPFLDLKDPPPLQSLFISTYHSFAMRIMRTDPDKFGVHREFQAMPEDHQIDLVARILEAHPLDLKPKAMHKQIERWKNAQIDVNALDDLIAQAKAEKRKEHAEFLSQQQLIYYKYQAALESHRAVDFADMINIVVQTLEQDADIRTFWHQYFAHKMGDEYQDSNDSQFRLMRLLCGDSPDFFCVGDPDQEIMAFQGANRAHILNFTQEWAHKDPDLCQPTVCTLDYNYRCTANILSAAHSLIRNNVDRYEKSVQAANKNPGPKVRVHHFETLHDEARFIAEAFKINPRPVTILMRTNPQCKAMETALLKYGIPTFLYRDSLLKTEVAMDLFAWVSFICWPGNDVAFERAIKRPPRGVGPETLGALRRIADDNHRPLIRSIHLLREYAIQQREIGEKPKGCGKHQIDSLVAVLDFVIRLHKYVVEQKANQTRNGDIVNYLVDQIDYRGWLKGGTLSEEQMAAKLQQIDDFIAIAHTQPSLEAFVEQLSMSGAENYRTLPKKNDNVIGIMTGHGAKGKEFDEVWSCGWEDGNMPSFQAVGRDVSPEDAIEGMRSERRIAYVTMTRAAKVLHLTYVGRRGFGGEQREIAKPSPFLSEIDPAFIEDVYHNGQY